MSTSRKLYQVAAWLFVIGVLVQTFFAGMVVVARLTGWENHVNLGHTLSLPLIVMLVTMFTGRMTDTTKRLTWLLFAAYFIQADILIFMRDTLPLASAVHPVFALVDFALGWKLAQRSNDLKAKVLPAA